MNRRAVDTAGTDWSAGEKRRLLAGLASGVWSLAGASYRFGLNADEILHWQRTLPVSNPTSAAGREHGLDLYVELL